MYQQQDAPYGSWKDIKYFCNYLKEEIVEHTDAKDIANLPVFHYILNIVVEQLNYDVDIVRNNVEETLTMPSLLCKWLPRETSDKFGWLAVPFATACYPEWMYKESVHQTDKRQKTSYEQPKQNNLPDNFK